MCGIIGYNGTQNAKRILMDGLTSLEYRGYDSAGICFFNSNNDIEIIKNIGKVEKLNELVKRNNSNNSLCDRTYSLGNTWQSNRRECSSSFF